MKRIILRSTLFGAALSVVVFSGCERASRHDGAPNGVAMQRENGANAAPSAGSGPLACTDASGQPIESVMTLDSPVMNGAFFPHGWPPPDAPAEPQFDVAPTCDSPLPMPTVEPAHDYHYAAYTFANAGDAASCISVRRVFENQPGDDGANGETIAYLGSFDPNDITKNYLADVQFSQPGTNAHELSFNVPAHATFVIVLTVEQDGAKLQAHDQLSVKGCGNSQSGTGGGETDAGASSSSSGGTSSGGDDGGGVPPATDDAGTGGKSW